MIEITESLIEWHKANPRTMPWRLTKDPYKIWVSEIILQQTRIEQGLPYYLSFIREFPNIKTLAQAPLDKVLSCWKGLGYYSRARNMHKAAIEIQKSKKGVFPKTYDEIIELKGIGEYTAAAIASFAFGEKHPVLDGNVIRLISRLFMIDGARNSAKFKKECYRVLNELIADTDQPALFNQAIMDLGSIICKPQKPKCEKCVLSECCDAKANGVIDRFPPKKQKRPKSKRYFHYFVVQNQKNFILIQRKDKDIWRELYTFPAIETPDNKALSRKIFMEKSRLLFNVNAKNPIIIKGPFKQSLSHQDVCAYFYEIELENETTDQYIAVQKKRIGEIATPRIITTYLEKYYNINQ